MTRTDRLMQAHARAEEQARLLMEMLNWTRELIAECETTEELADGYNLRHELEDSLAAEKAKMDILALRLA